MKTLVFSDTHLSEKFEEKKYQYLEKLIQGVDRVIINGDFWDGYLTTFDLFLRSKWSGLFPLLKEKQTVYIYGNHNKKVFSDDRTNLFSTEQTERYVLRSGGKTFIIEHGNRLLPGLDELFQRPRKLISIETLLYSYYEEFITRAFKHTSRFWGVILNNKLKRGKKNDGNFFIFGHTHFAEFDLIHNFAVSGIFQYGLAQYLLIEDGCITPKSERYE